MKYAIMFFNETDAVVRLQIAIGLRLRQVEFSGEEVNEHECVLKYVPYIILHNEPFRKDNAKNMEKKGDGPHNGDHLNDQY